jgi:hypothetical protein
MADIKKASKPPTGMRMAKCQIESSGNGNGKEKDLLSPPMFKPEHRNHHQIMSKDPRKYRLVLLHPLAGKMEQMTVVEKESWRITETQRVG